MKTTQTKSYSDTQWVEDLHKYLRAFLSLTTRHQRPARANAVQILKPLPMIPLIPPTMAFSTETSTEIGMEEVRASSDAAAGIT